MSLSGVKKPISAASAPPGAATVIAAAATKAAAEIFTALRVASTLDAMVLGIICLPPHYYSKYSISRITTKNCKFDHHSYFTHVNSVSGAASEFAATQVLYSCDLAN